MVVNKTLKSCVKCYSNLSPEPLKRFYYLKNMKSFQLLKKVLRISLKFWRIENFGLILSSVKQKYIFYSIQKVCQNFESLLIF
jgi:hypothetical protein